MMGILATPEAGAAAGTAGFLATRVPQVQAGLARLLPLFGKTPAAARTTQKLEPEVRELTGIERSRILGMTGERLAGIVQKAKVSIPSLTGTAKCRIPDDLTETTLTEVKNVGYLRFTPQLQDYLYWVAENGKRFDLVVRENTVLSGELQRVIDAPGSLINLIRGLPPL